MGGIERLRILNFRNIHRAELAFEHRITVFHGENAQGKTNVLEAIHFVTNLMSFRTRSLDTLLRHGEEAALVEARVADDWGEALLGVRIEREGRKATLDGKAPESVAAYLARNPTVFFGPQDLDIARGNQELRRRFVDRAAFFSDPLHLERLRNYARALKQRNAALRRPGTDLSPWNEELARVAWEVQRARSRVVAEMTPAIARLHREISGGREEPEIRFQTTLDPSEDGWKPFLLLLEEHGEEDRKRGFTHHGPHRDRISVRLGGRELKNFASQGQQRTFALSLKLALLARVEERDGSSPAFLLDDPGSELDRRRLGFLGEFLTSWKGQVFIAGVSRDDVPFGANADRGFYSVAEGVVSSASTPQ